MSYDFQDWGLIHYDQALKKQLELVEHTIQTQSPGTIIFCSHPAIVTMGRKTKPEEVALWKGDLLEVSRGGRATYHGPSQLVIYPIVNLELENANRKKRDIGQYLRNFENAIVDTLKGYDISSQGRSLQKKSEDESTEETGVWMGSRKIASLGIAVKRWVTYHGAAINLDQDPEAFKGINPCGFQPSVMISLEEALGRKVSRSDFQNLLHKNLINSI